MSLCRPFLCLLLPVAMCALAPTPDGLAQQPLQIDPFVVQPQSYAAIDLSGTSTGGLPVDLVALADDNLAAFSFNFGQNADGLPAEYHVTAWNAGALTAAPALTLDRTEVQGMTQGGAPQSVSFHYSPSNLLATGTVFGSAGGQLTSPNIFTGHIFSAVGNAVSPSFLPSPCVLLEPSHYSELSGVAPDGSVIAGAGLINTSPTYYGTNDTGPWQAGFITSSGKSDVFDLMAPAGFIGSVASTRFHGQDYFEPYAINVKGWGLGYGYGPGWSPPWASGGYQNYQYALGYQIWNADQQSFVNLPTAGVAINADNDVLVSGSLNPTTHLHEGAFLFEQGATGNPEAFLPAGASAGLLPANAREHLRDIQPWLLSNRAHPTDATTVQPVLYVVLTADIQRDPATWQTATFLLRKLSDNTWDLHEVVGAAQFDLRSINASGVIAAVSKADSTVVPPKHALLLFPVGMMVDGNRDGEMSFTDLTIYNQDTTTKEKPYPFWLNNNHDEGMSDPDGEWEEDSQPVGSPDCNSDTIQWRRDLEDFTRLWISFKGLTGLVKQPDVQVRLEWRPTDGQNWTAADGNPAIRVFKAFELDGGRQYLDDSGVAWQQLDGAQGPSGHNNFSRALGTNGGLVPRGGAVELPADFLSTLSEGQPNKYLLFEGYAAGKGRLIVTLYKDGQQIGEYPPVYLELKDVKDMYERRTVGDVEAANTSLFSSLDYQQWPANSARLLPTPSGQPLSPPRDETQDYVLWVHGWNMPTFDKDSYGDTAFKRLFWQGYKGRFGTFRWPTFHFTSSIPPTHHFDASEHRAWASSTGLLGVLNELNSGPFAGKVRMMAHSMGNVVAGEALRQAPAGQQVVHTYVASQAAIPAHCYDANAPLMPYVIGLGPETPNVYAYSWQAGVSSRPDQWQGEGRPSYMHSIYMGGKAGRYFNYYNDADWALTWPRWQFNQQTKPDADYSYEYAGFWRDYGRTTSTGSFATKWLIFPTDRYEIFAWAAESRSFALGAQWVAGVVGGANNVDLKTQFGYDGTHKFHSGQFRGTNMERRKYWERLLINCGLKEDQ